MKATSTVVGGNEYLNNKPPPTTTNSQLYQQTTMSSSSTTSSSSNNNHHNTSINNYANNLNFNPILPSIHNLTQSPPQQPSSTTTITTNQPSSPQHYHPHLHHQSTPPPPSWRNIEQKQIASNEHGHDLIQALSPPQILREGPPYYKPILKPCADIVPIDSFVPGYISGYNRKNNEMHQQQQQQATSPVPAIKISQYSVEEHGKVVPNFNTTSSTSSGACTGNSAAGDASQARMACINCRKSHRKW